MLTLAMLAITGLAGVAPASAQTPPELPAPASSAAEVLGASAEGAPVRVWNRTVVTLYAPFHGISPADRARSAGERIEGVIDKLKPTDIYTSWVESGSEQGVLVHGGNLMLFGLLPGDVEGGDRAALERAANQAVQVLRETVRERDASREPGLLLRGVGLSVLASVVLFALCWALMRVDRMLQRRLIAITHARLQLNIAGFDLRPLIWTLLRRLASLVRVAAMLFLGYLWLSFVLRQFPYTSPWGEVLGQYLVNTALDLGMGLVNQLPNLLTLVVIFLVTRGVVRLIGAWFRAVEAGTVTVGWLEAPTAVVTRRLVSALIWLFALIVAYPYIPGSNSDAFKGVTVFLGVMLSLGSAGIVNQVMSGLVVLYSRAVRTGDWVHVGDYEGAVLELGALSMKLVTRTREEVSVPNSVLSSSPMRNFTRQSRQEGLLLTVTVSVGYDTPWRQVDALLELAAARTSYLLKEPRPFVLHTALADYYIVYQLNAATAYPAIHVETEAELNRHIVDAFNEFGVQVMSPHFRRQPEQKVWVPPERWYEAPAAPPPRPEEHAPSPSGGPPAG
ncbi:mechanosensitive ion channel family protein [Dyella solisilvae]|uniref:mechanosensitive ion channel family protein n=1 Tax=Dyella solisilvae TaxID=1920168 RepID=UPI0011C05750|nr:mechanosensitive ion channel domain-containing protein [Dyella solisilvae]